MKKKTRYIVSTYNAILSTSRLIECILFIIKYSFKGYKVKFYKYKVEVNNNEPSI